MPGVLELMGAEEEIRVMLPGAPIDELSPIQKASLVQRWRDEKPQTQEEGLALLDRWLEDMKRGG